MYSQYLYLLSFLILLTACGGSNSSPDEHSPNSNSVTSPTNTSNDWYRPSPQATWQWQLQGLTSTSHDVEIYDIDLFDSTTVLIDFIQSNNKKVICYFSGGSYENWRPDADLFEGADLGNSLDGWEGERWLDIRSTNVRNTMKTRLDLAKQKGCDGVEPDNMDGYTNNSGFSFTAQDQLAFNRFIAQEAHARNLAVGLKNDLNQINELVDDFDFAVNEQCFEFAECDLLTPFIDQGKAVLNAEYKDIYVNNSTVRQALCNESKAMKFSTLVLPLELDDSFRYSCSE